MMTPQTRINLLQWRNKYVFKYFIYTTQKIQLKNTNHIAFCLLLLLSLTAYSKERAPKPENRFSFSAGVGPSYSIWNDKLLVDGEDTVFVGLTTIQKKKPVGFNLFGEFSCMFRRNFYLTVGMDYNQFSRVFSGTTRFYSPYYPSEISFDYNGRLIDRNLTTQFTINKKIKIKNNSIHFGMGIFFMNTIEPAIYINLQPPPYQTNFTVSERNNWEFGFPFQMSYEYSINKKWSIGFKAQYQYLLSTRNSQNIYFSPYFRLNIQKMEEKNRNENSIR